MRYVWIAALMLGVLPAFASADRGARYSGGGWSGSGHSNWSGHSSGWGGGGHSNWGGHSSGHSSWSIGVAFGYGGWYGGYGYSSCYRPAPVYCAPRYYGYGGYYAPAVVYTAPPVVYSPPPVYYSAPAYYAPPAASAAPAPAADPPAYYSGVQVYYYNR